MSTFEPMFRFGVRHDYYVAGPPPVAVEPDETAKRLASRPDVRLRYSPGLVEAFCDTDRSALRMAAEDGMLDLVFRLRASDPAVMTVTDVYAGVQQQTVVIDTAELKPGALHAGPAVSAGDVYALEPGGLLTAADLVHPPMAIVRLNIGPAISDQTYFIRFGAAKRFLTYNVTGGAEDAKFSVRDTEDEITFEKLDPREGPDGRTFRRFRSTTAVAASSRPQARFELVSDGPFGKRVVIPVLPAPAAAMGAIDPSGDPPGVNADMYVNL